MNRNTNCYRCASPPIQIALVELRSRVFRTSSATLLQPWDAKKTLGVKPSLVFDYCTNLLMGYIAARFLVSSFLGKTSSSCYIMNEECALHYPDMVCCDRVNLGPRPTLLFASYFLSSSLLHLSVCLLQQNNMRSRNTQHRSGGRRASSL